MKRRKIISVIMLLIFALVLFCSCGKITTTSDNSNSTGNTQSEESENNENKSSGEDTNMEHSQVKVTMEKGGEFIIELYPEYAPKTVENFLKLVNDGFYNGLTFHRVFAGFMAQGGDPDGTGTGGSAEKIKGEFASNGFTQNTLSHTRGVVSMARSEMNDSASSQFFICYTDGCTALDGDYAAFGKVIKGMEVVDAFTENEMTYNSIGEKASPVEPIYIDTMEQVK